MQHLGSVRCIRPPRPIVNPAYLLAIVSDRDRLLRFPSVRQHHPILVPTEEVGRRQPLRLPLQERVVLLYLPLLRVALVRNIRVLLMVL